MEVSISISQTTATRMGMPLCWFQQTSIFFLFFFTQSTFQRRFFVLNGSSFGECWFTSRAKPNFVELKNHYLRTMLPFKNVAIFSSQLVRGLKLGVFKCGTWTKNEYSRVLNTSYTFPYEFLVLQIMQILPNYMHRLCTTQ